MKTELTRCDCPDCRTEHVEVQKKHIYDSAAHYGIADDGPELWCYELRDGTVAYEIVQACPWSSGPCIFLALTRDPKDKSKMIAESLWSDEEIDHA